jgi:uncharacterized protein YjaZ
MHGVLYGFAQSLALIPGVSRSGATIAMGRFMGYMIVKQFMENNDVSPKELMHIPYNKILQKYQVN